MFPIVLVILLSTAMRLQAAPGLGPVELGFNGGLNQLGEGRPSILQPPHYAGSEYFDFPPQHMLMGYVGPHPVYVPGRLNLYSHPHYRSTAPNIPYDDVKKGKKIIVYETYLPAEIPQPYDCMRFPHHYYKIIETYMILNHTDIGNNNLHVTKKVLKTTTNIRNEEVMNTKTDTDLENPKLQMRLVGFVPKSHFRQQNPSLRQSDAPSGIPFYPVNLSGRRSQDVEGGLPPVMYSTYRMTDDLPPTYPKYLDSSENTPDSSEPEEYGSTRPGNYVLRPELFKDSSFMNKLSEVTPNRIGTSNPSEPNFLLRQRSSSNNKLENYQVLRVSQNPFVKKENGYVLFDVQPIMKSEPEEKENTNMKGNFR